MAEAAAAWRGYISFGLISVPIRLYPAARPSRIHFHEIHRTCGTRVRQPLYCPHHQRPVSRDETVMGYQVDKDKYVLVEPQELKKLEPASSKAMEILQLVNLSEVAPLYYETSYFSVPEEAGRRGYTLLLQAMERLKLAAVVKLTLHHRERTVILRSYEHGLTIHRKEYGRKQLLVETRSLMVKNSATFRQFTVPVAQVKTWAIPDIRRLVGYGRISQNRRIRLASPAKSRDARDPKAVALEAELF